VRILPYVHMYANTGLLCASIVMLMPMFIKTLSLALLLVSGSAFAEWRFLTASTTGNDFYFDPATIRKDGDMRTVWTKTEIKTPVRGVSSMRTKLEINCKKELIRDVAFAVFTKPNLNGELLSQEDLPNAPFTAIAPDTIDNAWMRLICK